MQLGGRSVGGEMAEEKRSCWAEVLGPGFLSEKPGCEGFNVGMAEGGRKRKEGIQKKENELACTDLRRGDRSESDGAFRLRQRRGGKSRGLIWGAGEPERGR